MNQKHQQNQRQSRTRLNRKRTLSSPHTLTSGTEAQQPLTPLIPPQQMVTNQNKQVVHRNILNWQKVSGNHTVARYLQQRPSQSTLAISTLAAETAVQRDHSEYDYVNRVTTPVRIVVTLGPPGTFSQVVEVANYDDLAEAYRLLGTAIFFDQREFFPDFCDNDCYQEWSDFDSDVRNYTGWYFDQPAQEAPYIAEVKDMRKRMADGRKLALKCRRAFINKDRAFKEKLGAARRQALEADKEVKRLLRMKFLSGDSGSDTTSAFLWTMADHLLTFSDTVADAMQLPYSHVLAVSRLIPGAVTLANVVVNWTTRSPMLMGSGFEGLADLNNAVGLAGAANSFFVNPGYLVTAYVGPMLNAIIGMLGKLQSRLIRRNDEAAAFLGVPLYVNAEPGGAPMWNYMVTAMRASSSSEIHQPSGDIFSYFDKFRERFDEFGKSKYKGEMDSYRAGDRQRYPTRPGAIPTESSYILFTKVNAKRFPGWLFHHRQMVWTLLYGARDPKRAKLTTE